MDDFKRGISDPKTLPTLAEFHARAAKVPAAERENLFALNIDLVEDPHKLEQVYKSTDPMIILEKDGKPAGIAYDTGDAWCAISFDYHLMNPYRFISKKDWTVKRPMQAEATKAFLHATEHFPAQEGLSTEVHEEAKKRLIFAGMRISNFLHLGFEDNPKMRASIRDPLRP